MKIYAQIILAAVVADRISDLDSEGVLSQFGLGFLDAVPGSRLILDSAFDGSFNALVTLRIGFVTQRCLLNAGKPLFRSEVRKAANKEARGEFKNVIPAAVPQVPEALQKILQAWL
jgi:hypothetical protein